MRERWLGATGTRVPEIAVEGELTQLQLTGRGQDGIRYPGRLVTQLSYLGGGIGSSDFAPTEQQQEVYRMLSEQLQAVRGRYDQVMSREVAGFNAMLRGKNLQGIIAP